MASYTPSIPARLRNAFDRIEFPLTEREMMAMSRRRLLYAMRGVWAGYIALGMFFLLVFPELDTPLNESLAEFLDQALRLTSYLQIAAVTTAGLLAPSMIAREQEEKTLQLLVVAGFRPRDIFWAKYLGVFLPIVFIVFLPLPIYVMATAFNVPVEQYITALAHLSVFAAAVCALGLAVSTLSKKAGDALLIMLVLLAVWTALPAGLDMWGVKAFNPLALNGGLAGFDTATFALADWFVFVAVHGLIFASSVAFALYELPKRIYFRASKSVKTVEKRRNKPIRGNAAIHFARANAVGLGGLMRNPKWALGFAVLTGGIAFRYPLVALPALVLLAYDVASSATKAARDGVLLGMLLMPIDDRHAARDLLAAYFRHTWMYVPAIFIGFVAFLTERSEILLWHNLMAASFGGNNISFAAAAPIAVGSAIAGLASALLASTNLSLQGASPIYAALIGTLAFVELTFAGIVAGNIMAMIFARDVSTVLKPLTIVTVTTFAIYGLFFLWYYPRYFKSLRAALFEDSKRKRKNW